MIYAPSQPGGGTGETHPNGTSGRGDHPADDRAGCARLWESLALAVAELAADDEAGRGRRGSEGALMAIARVSAPVL